MSSKSLARALSCVRLHGDTDDCPSALAPSFHIKHTRLRPKPCAPKQVNIPIIEEE